MRNALMQSGMGAARKGLLTLIVAVLTILFGVGYAEASWKPVTGTVTVKARADSVGQVDGRYRLRFARIATRNDQPPRWGRNSFRIKGSSVATKKFFATGLYGLRLDAINPETGAATQIYENNDFQLSRGIRTDVLVELVPDNGGTNPPPTGFASGFHVNNVNLAPIYFIRLTRAGVGGDTVTYAMRDAATQTVADPVTAGEAAEILPQTWNGTAWVPAASGTYAIDLIAQDGTTVLKSLPNQQFVSGQVTTIGAATSAAKRGGRVFARTPLVVVDGVVVNAKTVSTGMPVD